MNKKAIGIDFKLKKAIVGVLTLFLILNLTGAKEIKLLGESSNNLYKTGLKILNLRYKSKEIEIKKEEGKSLTSILSLTQDSKEENNYILKIYIFLKNRFWSNGFTIKINLEKSDKFSIKNFGNYFKGNSLILYDETIDLQTEVTQNQQFTGEIKTLNHLNFTSVSLDGDLEIEAEINFDDTENLNIITLKNKYLYYILIGILLQISVIILIRKLTKSENIAKGRFPLYGLILSNFYIIACFHCYIRALILEDKTTTYLLYFVPYLSFFNIFLILPNKKNLKKPIENKENFAKLIDEIDSRDELSGVAREKKSEKKISKPWIFWYFVIGCLTMLVFDAIWPIALNVTIAATVNYGVALENMLYVRNNTLSILVYLSYSLYVLLLYFMCYFDNGVNLDVGDTGHMEKYVFFLSTFKFFLTVSVVWCKYGWTGEKVQKKREREDLDGLEGSIGLKKG